MSDSLVSSHEDLLDSIYTLLQPHFPKSHFANLRIMVDGLYSESSMRELSQYEVQDLVGMVLTLWRSIQERNQKHGDVSVVNPNVEEHEWQSQHTIVTVLHSEAPFVIDTARLYLNASGMNIHSIFHHTFFIERDNKGQFKCFSDKGNPELLLCLEIDRTSSSKQREFIRDGIVARLKDVVSVVDDFSAMAEKTHEVISELDKTELPFSAEVVAEAKIFMEWLESNHFTFLAYDEYEIREGKIKTIEGSALGLFRDKERGPEESIDQMSDDRRDHVFEKKLLVFTKSSKRSTVHRSAYSDYVLVKRYDKQGKVIGGRRFMGLYTSSVYNQTPQDIPVIRHKINQVLVDSGFAKGSHRYKELCGILYNFPRDELIQSDVQTLLKTCKGVLTINERKQIRLFLRKDPYSNFISALVYMPREVFNTQIRVKVHDMLSHFFDAEGSDFTTFFSESVLARTRFVFKLSKPLEELPPVDVLENRIVQLARRWSDELQLALCESYGEEQGIRLFRNYEGAFAPSYTEHYSPRVAVADIGRIEDLHDNTSETLSLSFFRNIEPNSNVLKLKLFNKSEALLLSDLIPVLENLGLKVVDEFPFEIQHPKKGVTWIYDFNLIYEPDADLDPSEFRDDFSDAFINIWQGHAENDAFNQLILGSSLNWRDVAMMRAYSKYMKQTRFGLSQDYVAQTLIQYKEITEKLASLFSKRFKPMAKQKLLASDKIQEQIEGELEVVQNINEDRILRRYAELIGATIRTNFYQNNDQGKAKDYISLKLDPALISNIPLPKPKFEIFVYSPRVEGVHLRGGSVSRGGLRWSDRNEDFRTEVLGLVKAQQVKNAVIVPVGAKGGFVAKHLPNSNDREAFMAEGIACYKTFIRGLLDVTDNLVETNVVPPKDVVRYDGDDPYLVVAADKGTASFSDIANEVALSYGFWLGDAFASGGSNGYDHKKMGITARGAWVSVQRHFRELGTNVQSDSFTCIGIGDMSGDVFGNGMLRSDTMKMVGAFNHLNIFVDPDPDPAKSFAERKRMFELPRSSWTDYNEALISKGGGVFSRNSKSIPISDEMKRVFDISDAKLTPNELISAMLKAPVDLLWNGGIGTYVKASTENDTDIGDKANDALRVNGKDLRCKVIGEGGNLGFSQLGRTEYSLNGGRCFTDFIDNAGGVDCSDHEVNMKILLDDMVANGDMTVKQRNETLEAYTEDVSGLVLNNNYRQTQALGVAVTESYKRIEEYRRLISALESEGKLNRELELLPTDDVILDRKANDQALTRPELSVLISYVKGDLKALLAVDDLVNDKFIRNIVETEFPTKMVKKFSKPIHSHRLRKEIIATQVANDLVNHLGITAFNRLHESTGATAVETAKAFVASREIFGLHALWAAIESLDYKITPELQSKMMLRTQRMARRGTRWLIKNYRTGIDIDNVISLYREPTKLLIANLSEILPEHPKELWEADIKAMVENGVPEELAYAVASTDMAYITLGIVAVAQNMSQNPRDVASCYFSVGEALGLEAFARLVNAMNVNTHWQAMARESYRDDLEWQQRRITQGLFVNIKKSDSLPNVIDSWLEENHILVDRWLKMLNEIRAVNEPELSMYSVAIRELLDLSQATMPEF